DLGAYAGLLVPGTNVIAVGAYNVDSSSSDLVFDGELVVSQNAADSTLFAGSPAQAQHAVTSGWSGGAKTIKVTADDAVCATPLVPADGTFTFYNGSSCVETGSIGVLPGQTLQGGVVDLTSIVQASNAVNIEYRVTESGGCPAQSNVSVITKRDTWKYNGVNNGNIGTGWKDTAYDDSGWNTGSGIFGYGESYISTLIGGPGQMSEYFRREFTICSPEAVTSMKFNATYDDGMAVYINGTQVIAAGVSGNPPAWDFGPVNHESNQTYQTFDLGAYAGLLVPGTNVIAVGAYNVDSSSSDLVFDGELVVSQNATDGVLFIGDDTQAAHVDTSGWTAGEKYLEVTGDDAVCLTPLSSAYGIFTYENGPSNVPASLVISDPDGVNDAVVRGAPYDIRYSLSDPDDVVTAAFYYDTDNTGLNGVAISGACAAAPEGTNMTCRLDTSGMTPGSYFIYGRVNGGAGQISAYSNGRITINNLPGITVTPTSGLVTTESGGIATFSVVLNTKPAARVTIYLGSSDLTEGKISTSRLRFTASNWSKPQTVTVTGVNDTVKDGNQSYTVVTSPAISSDPAYNKLNPADVSVINTDND
ncbi:MAG: hypothetical protein AB1499_04870, partial [Nitrospirota bacterium]